MQVYDIIHRKRDGAVLTQEEIRHLVQAYTDGRLPDYQMAAWLMAVYFRGMTKEETVWLTDAMAHSGDILDLSRFGSLSADKHSTGGVGDKTSLIVCPIVAAAGGKVAKMSGRGLGHTGGTVDKLESIPGFQTTLSNEAFLQQVDQIGMALVGQTADFAPADKKMYALRDVTATVDSIPLITASIMSKKLAAGAGSIVLDVKVGSGAFMKTADDARCLAQNMVDIGRACGRRMAALITDMDAPLGYAVGNVLEVKEAIEVLSGKARGNLRELCLALAATLISLSLDMPQEEAQTTAETLLDSGVALAKMREWIAAQGGDVTFIDDPSRFDKATCCYEVISPADGYITSMNAEEIGGIAVMLGAGRATKEDNIDHAAGILLRANVGDQVSKGDVLCELHTNRAEVIETARRRYLDAVTIGDIPATHKPLIYETVR